MHNDVCSILLTKSESHKCSVGTPTGGAKVAGGSKTSEQASPAASKAESNFLSVAPPTAVLSTRVQAGVHQQRTDATSMKQIMTIIAHLDGIQRHRKRTWFCLP